MIREVEESIEILRAYKQRLKDSPSNLLEKDIKAFDAGIKALEQTRWIPVSERLPEDGRNVLVWFEYRYRDYNRLFQTFGLSYAYGGKWSELVNGSSGWKDLRIIAWCELPQPYKEEQNVDNA